MSALSSRTRWNGQGIQSLRAAALALALATAGCATPMVYTHVAPERAHETYACTARQLQDRGYLVVEDKPGSRLVARRDERGPRPTPVNFAEKLLEGLARREQVIVATLHSPSPMASALTIGPRDDKQPAGALVDSRAVLAACAPAVPLAPDGLRCVGGNRPLTTSEDVLVRTAEATELRGRALALAGDTLTVATESGPQQVQLGSLVALERRVPVARRDVTQRRTLLGGMIGAAVGMIGALASVSDNTSGRDAWNSVVSGANWLLLAPVVGVAAGWLSAAVLPDPVWRWKTVPLETCR